MIRITQIGLIGLTIFATSALPTAAKQKSLFDKAAQERNAENLLVLRGDPKLIEAYSNNWRRRWAVSVPF